MNQNSSVRKLVHCGVVAAIYVVLCLALQPLSYGAVQVRVAEALCLLPVFGAEYIVGVVLGCFLANLLGSTIVDVIFGMLAALLACLVTYKLRKFRFKGLAIAASRKLWVRRLFLCIAALTCGGILFFYKYFNFFNSVGRPDKRS